MCAICRRHAAVVATLGRNELSHRLPMQVGSSTVLIVNEYPKSGGSWIVNVLATTLGWQRADLYDLFPAVRRVDRRHPWYADDLDGVPVRGPETVVKGHEMPAPSLLPAGVAIIHMVRNPLDVAVSRWFYDSDFLPGNGLAAPPDIDRESHFASTVADWSAFVTAWCGTNTPIVTYESLLRGESSGLAEALARIGLGVSEDRLQAEIAAETPSVTRASLAKRFGHNTFVRRATVGDWTWHIEESLAVQLLDTAADALRLLASDPAARGVSPLMQAILVAVREGRTSRGQGRLRDGPGSTPRAR
jgi:hypothetical protein